MAGVRGRAARLLGCSTLNWPHCSFAHPQPRRARRHGIRRDEPRALLQERLAFLGHRGAPAPGSDHMEPSPGRPPVRRRRVRDRWVTLDRAGSPAADVSWVPFRPNPKLTGRESRLNAGLRNGGVGHGELQPGAVVTTDDDRAPSAASKGRPAPNLAYRRATEYRLNPEREHLLANGHAAAAPTGSVPCCRPEEAHPVPRRPQRPGRPDHGQRLPPVRRGAWPSSSTASKTIERDDGSTTASSPPPSTSTAGSTPPTRSISASTRRSPAPRSGRSSTASSRPDFFDLIVIDECHRGSAAEDSAWREILDYFSAATQIGLTATPKETEYVSNIHYFGEPVYTYSLKQGISDGFLAPYKVVRVHIDRDVEGWRPEQGQLDRDGELVEDRIYNSKDFDRDPGPRRAHQAGGPSGSPSSSRRAATGSRRPSSSASTRSTPARMRQALVNENPDLVAKNHRYVMRITGDDDEGKAQLDNFIDPRVALPRAGDHLAPALDRRRRADLPPDRARPRGRLDDRVQADRRPRHPRARGHARSSTSP